MNENAHEQCTARATSTGRRCRLPASFGEFCEHHAPDVPSRSATANRLRQAARDQHVCRVFDAIALCNPETLLRSAETSLADLRRDFLPETAFARLRDAEAAVGCLRAVVQQVICLRTLLPHPGTDSEEGDLQ